MFVIAGLGNPGLKYENTKHNVGFQVIDTLSKSHQIEIKKIKHRALIGEGAIGFQKVMLVKPLTYMNLSGESIQEILRFYKVPLEQFMVIFDDTSLPLSGVRIREKGSAGGHNGMKSIISHLGTEQFLRVKVGIGEKPAGWDLADYVLSLFSKDDAPLIQLGIAKAAEAVELLLCGSVGEAMNQINSKPKKQE